MTDGILIPITHQYDTQKVIGHVKSEGSKLFFFLDDYTPREKLFDILGTVGYVLKDWKIGGDDDIEVKSGEIVTWARP